MREQQLFLNRYIQRPNKLSLLYPELIRNGIVYVKDILSEDLLHIIPCDQIMQRYNLTMVEFIQYVSVFRCLPNDIRRCLAIEIPPQQEIPGSELNFRNSLQKMKSGTIYQNLVEK